MAFIFPIHMFFMALILMGIIFASIYAAKFVKKEVLFKTMIILLIAGGLGALFTCPFTLFNGSFGSQMMFKGNFPGMMNWTQNYDQR